MRGILVFYPFVNHEPHHPSSIKKNAAVVGVITNNTSRASNFFFSVSRCAITPLILISSISSIAHSSVALARPSARIAFFCPRKFSASGTCGQ